VSWISRAIRRRSSALVGDAGLPRLRHEPLLQLGVLAHRALELGVRSRQLGQLTGPPVVLLLADPAEPGQCAGHSEIDEVHGHERCELTSVSIRPGTRLRDRHGTGHERHADELGAPLEQPPRPEVAGEHVEAEQRLTDHQGRRQRDQREERDCRRPGTHNGLRLGPRAAPVAQVDRRHHRRRGRRDRQIDRPAAGDQVEPGAQCQQQVRQARQDRQLAPLPEVQPLFPA
jgi:hypothetical protein